MKIYIYATIDEWNSQDTDYVLNGYIQRFENGIAVVRDDQGNQQYINLGQVFCLVESNE